MDYRVSHQRLADYFASKGISTDKPGFYDHPDFLREEQRNPQLLNHYGRFVETLHLPPEYLERARREIPVIAEVVREQLATDPQVSQCANVNMLFSRMLNREGLWNYMVPGSLTITFPAPSGLAPLHFWQFCRKGKVAHVWLAAPPFRILDVTIKYQPYPSAAQSFMPDFVASSEPDPAEVQLGDLYDDFYLLGLRSRGVTHLSGLKRADPDLVDFIKTFPAMVVKTGSSVALKYVPCGVKASDKDLEDMRHIRLNGRYGFEIYEELVRPRLAQLRNSVSGLPPIPRGLPS